MTERSISGLASRKRPMHPGELFKREVLPSLKLSISEAARSLRVSRQTLHRMIAGTHAVTPEMALRLGRFCGSGPHLWLRMQQNYDLWRVAHDARVKVEIEKIPASPKISDLPDVVTADAAPIEMISSEELSEDRIGRLYDEIADLTEKLNKLEEQAAPARSLLESQIDEAYIEVRRLQAEEAEHFRQAFEANLELPLGEGPKVLREAHTLIGALEQILEAESEPQKAADDQASAGAPTVSAAPTVAAAPAEVPTSAKARTPARARGIGAET